MVDVEGFRECEDICSFGIMRVVMPHSLICSIQKAICTIQENLCQLPHATMYIPHLHSILTQPDFDPF